MRINSHILSLILLLSIAGKAIAAEKPKAVAGTLDLTGYDFKVQGPLKLDGEWLFYWEEFIDPLDEQITGGIPVEVPSAWRQLRDRVPEIDEKGFGSYALRILLPGQDNRLALRSTEVFSNSGYYVNGRNIGFKGFPGTNRYQAVFDYTPGLFIFDAKDSVIHLVIHVSNFEHRSGGLRGGVELGTPMQIMSKKADQGIRDAFLVGAFLIIGIYFMGLYIMRAEMYKLFFAMICLLSAFRIDLLGESGFVNYDFLNGITRLRLEYLSFDLLVPMFVLMIYHIFRYDFPRLILKIILWICLLQVIFVIVTPVSMFTGIFYLYMAFVMITSGIMLWVIIRAWIRGRAYAPGFAIGIAIAVGGAVNDMLYVADVIETGYIAHFTLFAYLLIYSIIFSRKSNYHYLRTAALSEEVSSMNENLEQLVADRTQELNQTSELLRKQQQELQKSNEQLQKIVEVKNKIFTVIGHDIRGPIGVANQMIETLINEDIPEEERCQMLTLLAGSTGSIMNLLENLLAWGRTQTGSLRTNPEKFELVPVIRETAEVFNLPVVEKNLKLIVSITDEIEVYADPEHVKLVLRNLFSNAIKFTREGGSILVASRPPGNDNMVEISVSDTGIGIPTIVLGKLFSDEEHHSTFGTGKEKGSGIGLKLCREVMELNNGWIRARSKTGEGSEFIIGLPAGESTPST